MQRFFVDEKNITADRVKIVGDDVKHISNSLRLSSGEEIIVVPKTGDTGIEYLVELVTIKREKIIGAVIEEREIATEAPVDIHLAQAVPKKKNMELVVQKATELGVSKIISLQTERTVVKLSGKKAQKRIARWQRIANAAAKQSQRGLIPEVCGLYNPGELLNKGAKKERYDLILFCYTGGKGTDIKNILKSFLKNKLVKDSEYNRQKQNRDRLKFLIVIGPEGGFSPGEASLFVEHPSVRKVSLGPRILRTETAGLVVTSVLMYEFDGFTAAES